MIKNRMKKVLTGMMVMMLGAGMLTGCGSKDNTAAPSYKNDVSTSALQEAVAEEMGENYFPNMEIPKEILEDGYGITGDMYEEITAQMPMISVNVDTLIIVKAKEGQEQAVKDVLLALKKRNEEDTMQYPMNIGKIQAGKVRDFGQYICYVQLGGDTTAAADENPEEAEAAVMKYCEEENEKALAVIEGMLTK